ncbi:MAG: hypothetical protein LUQ64_05710, partial [Methanomicrobiales archaeon]|nr:hypothetical protein [Methanomicrobiales archaeon]
MTIILQCTGGISQADAYSGYFIGTVRANDGGDGGPGTKLNGIPVYIESSDGSFHRHCQTNRRCDGAPETPPAGQFNSYTIDSTIQYFTIIANKPGETGYNDHYN